MRTVLLILHLVLDASTRRNTPVYGVTGTTATTPWGCNAGRAGDIVYVDDTDDASAAIAYLCKADSGGSYAWTDIASAPGGGAGAGACAANTWASTLNEGAPPTCTQPGFSNLSGAATDGQVPNTITIDLAATASAGDSATAFFASGTLEQAIGGTGAGSLTCAGGDFLTSNGTVFSCATPPGGGGGISYAQMVANNLAGF